MNQVLVKKLEIILSNSYVLYLKTQNYHWNVVGNDFRTLHALFEDQYNDLAFAIDNIAERIRAKGFKAPGTWSKYSELSTINEGNENATAYNMLEDIANDQEIMIRILKESLKIAQLESDEVTADLIIGRINQHEKNLWMIKSTLSN